MLYFIQERERILDFFEAVAGSRMMCNYMRFGGLFGDLPERIKSVSNLTNDRVRDYNTMQFLTEMVSERIPRTIDELELLLTQNEILLERSVGVGVLSRDDAINYSAAGPLLRGSGVAYDVRRADPYSIYDELDFDVAVENDGDMYARYRVRVKELRESVRILRQILPRPGSDQRRIDLGGWQAGRLCPARSTWRGLRARRERQGRTRLLCGVGRRKGRRVQPLALPCPRAKFHQPDANGHYEPGPQSRRYRGHPGQH